MDFISRKVLRYERLTELSRHFIVEKHPMDVYYPGQFIQIKLSINGETFLREYSLTSLPSEDFLSFAVKKVSENGVSSYLVENADKILNFETSLPKGNFVLPIKPNEKRTLVFFAAGSGITPIYAHIRYILRNEKGTQVYLFFGNKTSSDVMFKKEIEELQKIFPKNFFPYYVYSKEPVENPLFRGRIDAHKVELFINQIMEWDEVDEVLICGPEEMLREVAQTVHRFGIPKEHIHVEHFSTLSAPIFHDEKNSFKNQPNAVEVNFELDGEEHTIVWKPLETSSLLDAILDAGFDAPYSCKGGVCGSCMCKLLEGDLGVGENIVLTDSDLTKGYRLTCSAFPISDKVKLKLNI